MAFEDIILQIAFLVDVVGVLIILFGALTAIYNMVRIELGGKQKFRGYENAKRVFAQKIIFGLDFFITGDIIKTIALPSFDELVSLGIIVAIRSILSFFLSREVHLHKE